MKTFDIIIIGGGFSALAALANISRTDARKSVCVIADTGFDSFGPAYSTRHDEHLLNVRACDMGLYADDPEGFYRWAACDAHDYMPRTKYGVYLRAVLDTLPAVSIMTATATDIDRQGDLLIVTMGQQSVAARAVIIAAGNRIIVDGTYKNLVENTWQHDYKNLSGKKGDVAIIGTGLTALDTILSLHAHGFEGRITCYSGNGHLPLPHPESYDKTRIPPVNAQDFTHLRLSKLLQRLRQHTENHDWPYAIDSLRPHTALIWQTLSPADQTRFIRKYLWLWNMHRHRFAPHLSTLIDSLKTQGKLSLQKGRVTGMADSADGITLDIRGKGQRTFMMAFKCIGPSYRISDQALMQKMIDKNMVMPHENGYGLKVDGDFKAAPGIFVLGPPLFGQLLETVAVPDLRQQATQVAQNAIKSL